MDGHRRRIRFALILAAMISAPLTMTAPTGAGADESCVPGIPTIAAATGVGGITIYELISDYSWGYKTGVKQPLGAYKSGLSVHQITKSAWPDPVGNPDYVFWIDELKGSYG